MNRIRVYFRIAEDHRGRQDLSDEERSASFGLDEVMAQSR
jgi:hypothetical protein